MINEQEERERVVDPQFDIGEYRFAERMDEEHESSDFDQKNSEYQIGCSDYYESPSDPSGENQSEEEFVDES